MPHERLEQRSLALHLAIAAKLREHPELLAVAHDNLDRWTKGQGRSQPYLDTWRTILSGPFEEVLAVMAEDTARTTELRQSSPFAGVLEPRERWHIYDTFESGTHHKGWRGASLTIPTSISLGANRCSASFPMQARSCWYRRGRMSIRKARLSAVNSLMVRSARARHSSFWKPVQPDLEALDTHQRR